MTDIQKIADMVDDSDDEFEGGVLHNVYMWIRERNVKAVLTDLTSAFKLRSYNSQWMTLGDVEDHVGGNYDDGLENVAIMTDIHKEVDVRLYPSKFILHGTPRERRLSDWPNAGEPFALGVVMDGEFRFHNSSYRAIELLMAFYFGLK